MSSGCYVVKYQLRSGAWVVYGRYFTKDAAKSVGSLLLDQGYRIFIRKDCPDAPDRVVSPSSEV